MKQVSGRILNKTVLTLVLIRACKSAHKWNEMGGLSSQRRSSDPDPWGGGVQERVAAQANDHVKRLNEAP